MASTAPSFDPTIAIPPDAPPVFAIPAHLIPNYDEIVTDDGTAVDNLFTEKQQRLLTEPLYSSWAGPSEGRSFRALANVGLFHTLGQPPLVPDMMLALGLPPIGDVHAKENRSFFNWELGRPPDLVLEIVSDRRGGEDTEKLAAYARMGVSFYVIFDPDDVLQHGLLRAFALSRQKYEPTNPHWFPELGLGVQMWSGIYEDADANWLRWHSPAEQVVQTGRELAERERQNAERERQQREILEVRVRQLEAQMRAAGVEPTQ